jgi:HD-GYP domain-containing protein (c-di-GMP phosphodiesterase class II)
VPAFAEFAIDSANHHEWIDGQGYCRGLTGDALSTTARILAVADVVDALSADRPYRAGLPPDRVRAILDSESGTHFDRACVEVCDADILASATVDPVRHVA